MFILADHVRVMGWVTNRYATGSTSIRRAILGFLISPLMSSLAVTACTIAIYLFPSVEQSGPNLVLILPAYLLAVPIGSLVVGAPLTYAGMAIVGFPVWIVLRYTNNESFLAYTLLGIAGGFLLGPTLVDAKWGAYPVEAASAVGGGLTLLFFWLIAKRPNARIDEFGQTK